MKITSKFKQSVFEYELTEQDLLWSLKMVYGESDEHNLLDASCILWCMANRLVLLRRKYHGKKSFEQLIRAYSQSINPSWYRDGRFGKMFKGKQGGLEEQFKRREHIRDMKIEEIPERLHKVIDMWKRGQIPNPVPRAVQFAVPRFASKSNGQQGLLEKGLELIYDQKDRGSNSVASHGNVFYATLESSEWSTDQVSIVSDHIVSDSTPAHVKELLIDV